MAAWIHRSSVAIGWGALVASGATYAAIRAKTGWIEPVKYLDYDDDLDEQKTDKVAQLTFSQHLLFDASVFVAIGAIVFTARQLPALLGKTPFTPLSESPALTFAQELKQKLKIKHQMEFGATQDKFSEAAYVPDFLRIETPIVYLTPSSPKIVIAHEFMHVYRKHCLSQFLFTAALIPPMWATMEHFGGNSLLTPLPIISTMVLNKLFSQYCEIESDLMACDVVSNEDIKEGIESYKEIGINNVFCKRA